MPNRKAAALRLADLQKGQKVSAYYSYGDEEERGWYDGKIFHIGKGCAYVVWDDDEGDESGTKFSHIVDEDELDEFIRVDQVDADEDEEEEETANDAAAAHTGEKHAAPPPEAPRPAKRRTLADSNEEPVWIQCDCLEFWHNANYCPHVLAVAHELGLIDLDQTNMTIPGKASIGRRRKFHGNCLQKDGGLAPSHYSYAFFYNEFLLFC